MTTRALRMSRYLGLGAGVAFLVSHFLPAYSNASGFESFVVCWDMLLGKDAEFLSGGWFYYSGFVVANILFVGLAVALFVTQKWRGLRLALSAIIFLQVLSWWVVHAVQEPAGLREIQVGYYLWLVAYGLLLTAHLWKKPVQSLEPIPLAPSAV